MGDMAIKLSMLVVFFAVMVGIGLDCRRHTTDVSGFVLGGRSVGPWLTAFAYGTSYFSAVVFVGYAGQFGWKYGIAATWAGLGNAFLGSLLAWAVLGRRTRVMTQHLDSATMPEFFGKRFDSRKLKLIASVIIFIFLIPYTASLYNGLSRLFAMAFDIDYAVCVVVMAVLTGIYVIAGGYMATAINDFIQGIIMLVGICAVIAAVLKSQGGFLSALDGLARVYDPAASETPGVFASFFGPDPVGLLGVVLLTSLGTWGLPQMVHKFYTIKNEKAIQTGTLISTLFALVIAGGSYFMGSFGRLYYTPDTQGAVVYDQIVPTMLSQSLSDLLIGVVLILVLSASMSTLSSLVITSSSTMTLDFIHHLWAKDMSPKIQIRYIKLFCVFFVVLSVVIALRPNSLITSLMSLSWGALAGAFLGPFIYGLFWKGTTTLSVWVSFVAGVSICGANVFLSFTSPTTAGAIAILSSLVLIPLVSAVTPKLPANVVEDAFSCYQEPVVAPHVSVLNPVSEFPAPQKQEN